MVGHRARVEVGQGHGMDGGAGRRLSGGQGRGEADRVASVLSSLTATAWMVTLPLLVTA